MIALILLVFVECPVRIEIAMDVQGAEFEDGFATYQPPPRTGDLHAIFDQVTASAFDHAGGDGIALGKVAGRVQRRDVIAQGGSTLIDRFTLLRA